MSPGIWPVQGRSKTRPKLTTPKKWRKKTFFEHVIFPPKRSPQKVPNPPAPTPVRSKLPKSQGRQKSPYVDFKFPCDMQCACMYMHMYLYRTTQALRERNCHCPANENLLQHSKIQLARTRHATVRCSDPHHRPYKAMGPGNGTVDTGRPSISTRHFKILC